MSKKNTYTEEFRLDAARLVVEHGYSCKEAAARLGANSWSVRQWVKKFKATGQLSDARAVVGEDLADLRKENKQLRLENEILKKAAAYFARESLGNTLG